MSSGKLVVSVTEKLRNEIIVGRLNRGMRIIQTEWATKLNVSRMPIREAIQQLELDGLVKNIPNKGAIVIGIDVDELSELFFVRRHLEGQLAALALPFMTTHDIAKIDLLFEQMVKATDKKIYDRLHKEFHTSIFEKSPWKHTFEIIEYLSITKMATNTISTNQYEVNEEHRLIVEAIKNKEPMKLQKNIEQHIMMTHTRLKEYIALKQHDDH
ncbi:GntR family transcriptional regulator [Kurthia sibirica]|uniref:GntR family transcriptional regulator n=1 Tax=Kurthia sibirica TaxID=202750 RepID=A0A2U3ANU4_9BACL|nr:GntR family transcriptional regulator [Kurthia sibirica]PWI26214.1 GntR family transcriptional regulator [Kurthia sibirica]GEK34728.1 GntR family transcriptional regulator [Kurthia sibirica]